MFTDGFLIKWGATFLVRWQIFCICSAFPLCRVLNIRLPKYRCNLTTAKPSYLAQLSSQLCWMKHRLLFLSFLHSSSEKIACIFSCGGSSTCGTASKRVWDCVEQKGCKCCPLGDTLSVGIYILENLNVMSPLNRGSFFSFSFLEHLTGDSFMAESCCLGALLPGLDDCGLKNI